MNTIREYSFEQIICQCGYDMNTYDSCMASQKNMQPGYVSPFLRIDAYIIILCTEGELWITQNMQNYNLSRNSLFIYSPNNVIQVKCEEACSVTYVVVTPGYLCKNYIYWKQALLIMKYIRNKSLIMLSAKEANDYIHMADCILRCMERAKQSEWSKEALLSSMKMLFYTLFIQIKELAAYNNMQEKIHQNRDEWCFIYFIKLLSMHYKQERKVDFYASELCLTSKYLSTIIKKVSGKTPSEWIGEVVIEEVQYLLKYSNLSISEIAYQLNFTNCSFFGKYFKRHIGVSPYHYRIHNNIKILF